MTRNEYEKLLPRNQAYLQTVYSDIQQSREQRREGDPFTGWKQKLNGDWWYRNVDPLPDFYTWLMTTTRDPIREQ